MKRGRKELLLVAALLLATVVHLASSAALVLG